MVGTEVDVVSSFLQTLTVGITSRTKALLIRPPLIESERRKAKNKFFNIPSGMLALCKCGNVGFHYPQHLAVFMLQQPIEHIVVNMLYVVNVSEFQGKLSFPLGKQMFVSK